MKKSTKKFTLNSDEIDWLLKQFHVIQRDNYRALRKVEPSKNAIKNAGHLIAALQLNNSRMRMLRRYFGDLPAPKKRK
jgi:hypothetical protein